MKGQRAAIYFALFLSGAAALVYELVWSRMLQRVFGVSDLAVATVLAAYFMGLGLGNSLGGQRAARLKRPAQAYGALEACVALFALLSLVAMPLIHRVYAGIGEDASFLTLTLVRLGCSLVVLLPPTVLMGATLPVLVAALPKTEWTREATSMYAINTVGAVLGAGATGFVLVPRFGARASLVIAAGLSVIAAGIVLFAVRNGSGEPNQDEHAKPSDEEDTSRLAVGLAFFAGALALAGEVVWTRVLRLVVQGTTQAFAAMLVCFLAGIAIGSYVSGRRNRTAREAARALGYTQVAIAVLSALALAWTNVLPRLLGMLQGHGNLSAANPWTVLAVAASTLFPMALAIGTSIPLAWQIADAHGHDGASRAGRVLASNTVGGLAGSLVAGFALVPNLGVNVTVLVLIMLHLGVAAISMRAGAEKSLAQRVGSLVAPVAIALVILLAGPQIDLAFLLGARENPQRAILEGPDRYWRQNTVKLWEGRNTTVTVKWSPHTLKLFNDGRPESGFSDSEPGFGPELAMLGTLPALYAPHFNRAMVIGLGAGHTTAVMTAASWARLDVVELEQSVVSASRYLYEQHHTAWPLENPRVHLYVDDARALLLRAPPSSYDAVVSQPSHPWIAGSSALYTTEFFSDVKRALTHNGVFVLWINLFRNDVPHVQSVVRTLTNSFANVNGYIIEGSSLIFCASDASLPIGPALSERLARAGASQYFGGGSMADWTSLAATQEFGTAGARVFGAGAPILIDDRPSLEFDLARLDDAHSVHATDLDHLLRNVPWLESSVFAEPEALTHALNLVRARVLRVMTRPEALRRVSTTIARMDGPPAATHEMNGVVAEALGANADAVREYDAAGTATGALASDALHLADGEYAALLTHAEARSILPSTATPLLRASLVVASPEGFTTALRVADTVRFAPESPLRELVHALAEGGCSAFLSQPTLPASLNFEEVALAAERCAFATNDTVRAQAFARQRTHSQRVAAVQLTAAGTDAYASGNLGAAISLLSRALRANPAHAGAAATLARSLARTGHSDRARDVLRSALDSSRGLPSATAALVAAANELGWVGAPAADLPSEGQTSASTIPTANSTVSE